VGIRKIRNSYKVRLKSLKGGECLWDLDVDKRIIL
jgi:hypothetical protein